jgi:hypothetical protein
MMTVGLKIRSLKLRMSPHGGLRTSWAVGVRPSDPIGGI